MNLINIKRIGRRNNNLQWFKVPAKTYFEPNAIRYLADMPDVRRVTIVTDATMTRLGFIDRVIDVLGRRDERVALQIIDDILPEPTVQAVQKDVASVREFRPDTIIALGGGSPMDAAKVMWLLYEHPEVEFADMREKFFDIRKRAFTFPDLGGQAKLVCIPTTSGTGSEMTPFAVITDATDGKKYPLADYALTPTVAIVDPELRVADARLPRRGLGVRRAHARDRGLRVGLRERLHRRAVPARHQADLREHREVGEGRDRPRGPGESSRRGRRCTTPRR